MPVQYRSPRHQGELTRPLDQREATAHHVDRPTQHTLEPCTGLCLVERNAKFFGELAGDAQKLTPPERLDHAGPIGGLPSAFVGELLGDQPLAPQSLRGVDLAPEPAIAQGLRFSGDQFAIEPGRGIGPGQLLQRLFE